ncbi:MAG: ParB N-terminal domain-containing protein [Deltaproteobacteria bacterium]|nr:ParB N-terminal domain-containing protein [Deltaproteobacteria bacterium]
MAKPTTKIPISSIILDEEIYPRKVVDQKRVGIFAENIRDGFKFDPIEVEPHPDKPGKYRLLDGVHRWHAFKAVGVAETDAIIIKDLDGTDPLLYAAKKAIGPKQLTEDETRDTARRAYSKNTTLRSADIGKAIGRARRTVDSYIADLRAATQLGLDIKTFRMDRLGIPQERIAKRMGVDQKTIHNHLGKMAALPNLLNSDLARGFTVSQVAEKHGWSEPMVWSLALQGKEDLERFKEVGWGLRTWDHWYFNDIDRRFGDDWPGRIPAQMIAHILYYFSDQNDLVFDPMAGGGVVADTCLAFNRKCWSFDMDDRPDTRPEIEPCFWDITNLKWPIKGKTKPDLIIFDPPYFKKQSNNYDPDGISGLSKEKYLEFLESFFALAHLNAKKSTQMAFINADWRDFQNTPAKNETRMNSILINDYLRILNQSGWQETHIIQAPLSSERFQANVVSAMQKKGILGVTSRYVIMSKKKTGL